MTHCTATLSCLIVACLAAVGACTRGGDGAAGGVGSPCENGQACESGLYCYAGAAPLAGLCTMNCEVGTGGDDPCELRYPNTACVSPGVCAAQCGDGLACADGTQCQSDTQICGASFSPSSSSSGGSGGSSSGVDDSGGASSSASLQATGTSSTFGATATVDFTGAAANEADPGVYCELVSTTDELDVFATQGSNEVALRLYELTLGAGQSRSETFGPSGNTADVSASLEGATNTYFSYVQPVGDSTGGTCTTTITELDTTLQGSFDCPTLPSGEGQGGSLTLTFDCPLETLGQ